MNDEAQQSLPNFPATVVAYTWSYLFTFTLSPTLGLVAWAHPRLINSESLQLGPRHWYDYKSFSGDSDVALEWGTAALSQKQITRVETVGVCFIHHYASSIALDF